LNRVFRVRKIQADKFKRKRLAERLHPTDYLYLPDIQAALDNFKGEIRRIPMQGERSDLVEQKRRHRDIKNN
jgi:hypothetical protein